MDLEFLCESAIPFLHPAPFTVCKRESAVTRVSLFIPFGVNDSGSREANSLVADIKQLIDLAQMKISGKYLHDDSLNS